MDLQNGLSGRPEFTSRVLLQQSPGTSLPGNHAAVGCGIYVNGGSPLNPEQHDYWQ